MYPLLLLVSTTHIDNLNLRALAFYSPQGNDSLSVPNVTNYVIMAPRAFINYTFLMMLPSPFTKVQSS